MSDFKWLHKQKRTHEIVVRQKGVGATTYGIAEAIHAIATGIHSAYRDKGHSQITVSKGDRSDAFVNLDDSAGSGAAWKIEAHTGSLRKAAGLV